MAGGKHFKKPVSEDGLEANEAPAAAAPEPGRDIESEPAPAPAADEPDFFDAAPSGDESSVFSTIYQGLDAPAPAPVSDDGELIRVRKRRKRRRSKRPFIIAGVICALVVAVIGCGVAFASSAYGVYQDAQAVIAQAGNLSAGLTEGDSEALEEAAASIQESASSMAGAVDGPLWSVAAALPFVGTDVQNIRELVGVLDTLATEVLAPVAEQAESLNLGSVFVDGGVNVEVVGQLAQLVVDVAPAVSQAAATVDGLEEGSIDQLNSIVEQLADAMGTADSLCSTLSELAPYVEDMLGASGSRTYLILAHNTSELKCSGGFIGSVGTLTITNGTFELGDFSSFNVVDLYEYSGDTSSSLAITEEEDALFQWTYGVKAGDSGLNADFPREAELSKEFYERYYEGVEIDGVIALDTQVLANFLSLTGSVTTSDGTVVDASNCVEVIGYQIYWDYFNDESLDSTSNAEADAIFSEIAGLAFDSIMDNIGSVGIMDLVEVLAESTGEYRLTLWMDDADEQAALESLGVAGALNTTDDTLSEAGIFLNCQYGSKLSWWTLMDSSYIKSAINGDGTTTYTVTVTLYNTFTAEEVEESSIYIQGVYEGRVRYNVYLYAPAGGTVANVRSSTEDTAKYLTYEGLDVGLITVWIEPESEVTITYELTTSANATDELHFRTTPLAQALAEADDTADAEA